MARVFTICFQHKGRSYTALVSIAGKEDPSIRVITHQDSIQIHLPTGNLILSIADVLQRLYASLEKGSQHATLFVTQHISLQLLRIE